jgi:hypothetical protein
LNVGGYGTVLPAAELYTTPLLSGSQDTPRIALACAIERGLVTAEGRDDVQVFDKTAEGACVEDDPAIVRGPAR